MVTGEQVYNLALALIDEVTETGAFTPDNPDYYKNKSLSFLTMLQTELVRQDVTPEVITTLAQPLLLADRLALTVLPYGLAAHLLMSEDQTLASFFNARYDELKRKIPTQTEPITDKYNVLNGLL